MSAARDDSLYLRRRSGASRQHSARQEAQATHYTTRALPLYQKPSISSTDALHRIAQERESDDVISL